MLSKPSTLHTALAGHTRPAEQHLLPSFSPIPAIIASQEALQAQELAACLTVPARMSGKIEHHPDMFF